MKSLKGWKFDVMEGKSSSTKKPNFYSFLGGDKDLFSSEGVGLRLNLFWCLIFGVNMVKPFDLPERGMYFPFTITPEF